MRQTLPKSNILRGYQSFTNVITSGVSFQGTMLTGFLLTDTNDKNIAIGFSVPKKRVPLAVDRNRIRRLMRECVREHSGELFTTFREKNVGAKIVLMFKGEKNKQIDRLALRDVVPAWLVIQQQILKAL
ncbi:MAG: ribonuclease P protein component [Bacteroidota bacterium]